jgi:hypothetical protein
MEDWQNSSPQEKDNFFAKVIFDTFGKLLFVAVLPFLTILLFSTIRIFFKGNLELFYFNTKELILLSGLSIIIVFAYVKTSSYHFEDLIGLKFVLTKRRIILSILEGLLLLLMFFVVIFYLYIILFLGIFSLWSLKDWFSFYILIKSFIFLVLGLLGIRSSIHILIITKYSRQQKEHLESDFARGILQFRILGHIYKYKLTK